MNLGGLSTGSAIGAAQLASIVASSSPITLLRGGEESRCGCYHKGKAATQAARMGTSATAAHGFMRVMSGALNQSRPSAGGRAS